MPRCPHSVEVRPCRATINRRHFIKVCLALSAAGLGPKNVWAAASKKPFDAVIIGGGLSGLATAYKLKNKNILLLEKEPYLGGRVISGQWHGLYYAKGAEYMGPPEGDVADLLSGLGLKPTRIVHPVDAVARKGKFYFGENYLGFLETEDQEDSYWRLMDRLESLNNRGIEDGVFEDLGALQKRAELDGLTVEAWLNREGVAPLVQKLVDVENRGLFGASNRELSLLFNIPEMSWNMTDPEEKAWSDVFSFPRGMSEIVEAMEKYLAFRVITGVEVTGINVRGEGARITYDINGKTETIGAETVVITTPAPIAERLVKDGLSEPVRRALRSIPYAPYVTLNLFLKQRLWNKAWAASCPDEFFVTIYDAIRLQVKPNYEGESVLGVYIASEKQSDSYLLDAKEEEIVDRVLKGLEIYFPGISTKVAGYDLHRFRYAFPVFRPGYLDVLTTLHQDETTQGPLILAGDYMVYATIDGAVRSGCQAAELVEEWLED